MERLCLVKGLDGTFSQKMTRGSTILRKIPSLDSEYAAELYVDEVLDGNGQLLYLDNVVSVSALAEAEAADRFYGVQQDMFDRREILNGS